MSKHESYYAQRIGGRRCSFLLATQDGRLKHYGAPEYKKDDLLLFIDDEDGEGQELRILSPIVGVPVDPDSDLAKRGVLSTKVPHEDKVYRS